MAILPEHIWRFLHELEGRIRKVIKGVGRMDHETWRRFQNEARSEDATGVVDGDLVELFFVSNRTHLEQMFVRSAITWHSGPEHGQTKRTYFKSEHGRWNWSSTANDIRPLRPFDGRFGSSSLNLISSSFTEEVFRLSSVLSSSIIRAHWAQHALPNHRQLTHVVLNVDYYVIVYDVIMMVIPDRILFNS